MKTRLLFCSGMLATIFFCCPGSAFAQDVVVEEVDVVEYVPGKVRYYSDSFKNNWYVSAGAGAQTFLSERSGNAMYTLAMDVAVGKWLSPYLGLRLSAVGGALHYGYPMEENKMSHMRYAGVYMDLMWDLFNTFGGYNERRVFTIIPFAGAGGIYAFHNTTYNRRTYAFPATAGLKLNFRLSHYVDLFLEGRGVLVGEQFNGVMLGKQVEAVISAIGGITVKLGRDRFKAYNAAADQAAIESLNMQTNMLRAALVESESQLAATQAALDSAQAQVVVEEVFIEQPVCTQDITSVVRFAFDSANVTNEEMVNVYNVAQWLKKNPCCNIEVVGYADKETGSPAYNKQLSERRAAAVIEILTKKYNIDPCRITLVANGSETQLYPDNNRWNRIVVFTGKMNK